MALSIPGDQSGELASSRAVRAAASLVQALARAPEDEGGGEAARDRRVDAAELSVRGERLAASRRDEDAERRPDRAERAGPVPRRDADVRLEELRVRLERAGAVRAPQEAPLVEGPRERMEAERRLDTPEHRADLRRELSSDELRELRELQRQDRLVRAQENLHRAAGADLVRTPPAYRFEVGPDGRRYAVSAETDLELPRSSDPRAAAREAARARRAALAPANTSPSDQAFAARAASLEARARAEIPRALVEDGGRADETRPLE